MKNVMNNCNLVDFIVSSLIKMQSVYLLLSFIGKQTSYN